MLRKYWENEIAATENNDSNMNVAIVTQQLMGNYGGVLQNFALQTVLKRLGHNPVTIDYRVSSPLWFWVCQSIKTVLLYPIKSKRRALTPYRNIFPRKGCIMNFVRQHITLTEKQYLSYKKSIIHDYNIGAVVVGSDQVWRPRYNTDCLYDTYLSFVKDENILKLSYAASFGVDKWEYNDEQTRKCRELIKRFKAVSVRENSGVALCKEYLGVEAIEVLDPTLLLSCNDYNEVCADIPINRNRYVCCYILDMNNEKMTLIHDFASKHGCEPLVFSAHSNLKYSVEEWISLFRDATYVITDSFHGMVFSMIFHKEFYLLANAGRGSSRFISLLSKFGLEGRLVDQVPETIEKIDWESVDGKKKVLVERSLEFLNTGLSKS